MSDVFFFYLAAEGTDSFIIYFIDGFVNKYVVLSWHTLSCSTILAEIYC